MHKTTSASHHTKLQLQLLTLTTLALISGALNAAPKACEATFYPFKSFEALITNPKGTEAILLNNTGQALFTSTGKVTNVRFKPNTYDGTTDTVRDMSNKVWQQQGDFFVRQPFPLPIATDEKFDAAWEISDCPEENDASKGGGCVYERESGKFHRLQTSSGPLTVTTVTRSKDRKIIYLVLFDLGGTIKTTINNVIECHTLILGKFPPANNHPRKLSS